MLVTLRLVCILLTGTYIYAVRTTINAIYRLYFEHELQGHCCRILGRLRYRRGWGGGRGSDHLTLTILLSRFIFTELDNGKVIIEDTILNSVINTLEMRRLEERTLTHTLTMVNNLR